MSRGPFRHQLSYGVGRTLIPPVIDHFGLHEDSGFSDRAGFLHDVFIIAVWSAHTAAALGNSIDIRNREIGEDLL